MSEPDPERLRVLENRLQGLKARRDQAPKADPVSRGLSQGDLAWRMVIELATGIVVGAGMGYGLDKLFGTLPIFLVILCLLGFAAGVKTMLGTAQEVANKRAAYAAKEVKAAEAAADKGN